MLQVPLKRCWLVAFGPLLLLLSAPLLVGFGPFRPAGLGASSLGMADAVMACGSGVPALYANPSGLAQVPRHTFDGGFVRNPLAGASSLHVGSVDATSSWGLSGGVGYSYDVNWGLGAPSRVAHDLRMGLAASLDSEAGRILLGASSRYMNADLLGVNARNVSGWTTDFGVTVATGGLRFGAVLYNGLRVSGLEEETAVAPRRVGVAAGYAGEHAIAEANGTWGLDTGSGAVYRAGFGYQLGEDGLQLRSGYAYDHAQELLVGKHLLSAGLSWRTSRVSVDVSGAVNLAQSQEWLLAMGLTIVVPYDLN